MKITDGNTDTLRKRMMGLLEEATPELREITGEYIRRLENTIQAHRESIRILEERT